MTADKTPDLQGWVFVKAFDKQKWKKRFLRIKDKIVYTCETDDENVNFIFLNPNASRGLGSSFYQG